MFILWTTYRWLPSLKASWGIPFLETKKNYQTPPENRSHFRTGNSAQSARPRVLLQPNHSPRGKATKIHTHGDGNFDLKIEQQASKQKPSHRPMA